MDTSLLGCAKELQVAGLLVAEGIYVHYPLVDVGFDLVASNAAGTFFIPIQVKFKESRTGLALKRNDADQFVESEAVLAFGSASKTEALSDFWFIPARVWRERVRDTGRGDGKLVAYFADGAEWLGQYKGRDGLRVAFAGLLQPEASGVQPVGSADVPEGASRRQGRRGPCSLDSEGAVVKQGRLERPKTSLSAPKHSSMPDLSSLFRANVLTAVLTHVFNAGGAESARTSILLRTFVRVVDKALEEYVLAREAFEAYVGRQRSHALGTL